MTTLKDFDQVEMKLIVEWATCAMFANSNPFARLRAEHIREIIRLLKIRRKIWTMTNELSRGFD